MLKLFREHVYPSAFAVFGALLTVGSRVNDAYAIFNAGLPNGVWEAIGLTVFFGMVFVLLARFAEEKEPISEAAPLQPPQQKLLKTKIIIPGSVASKLRPRFKAEFARDAEHLRIFIDERNWYPSISHTGWSRPKRILIHEIARVSRNESFELPLFGSYEVNGTKLWRWGKDNSPPSSNDYLFMKDATYKGRIAVADKDGREEYCGFFCEGMETDVANGELLPRIRGEHMFRYDEPENEHGKNT